jgi:hypothetical protein
MENFENILIKNLHENEWENPSYHAHIIYLSLKNFHSSIVQYLKSIMMPTFYDSSIKSREEYKNIYMRAYKNFISRS